jgi:hypothetical protein
VEPFLRELVFLFPYAKLVSKFLRIVQIHSVYNTPRQRDGIEKSTFRNHGLKICESGKY